MLYTTSSKRRQWKLLFLEKQKPFGEPNRRADVSSSSFSSFVVIINVTAITFLSPRRRSIRSSRAANATDAVVADVEVVVVVVIAIAVFVRRRVVIVAPFGDFGHTREIFVGASQSEQVFQNRVADGFAIANVTDWHASFVG